MYDGQHAGIICQPVLLYFLITMAMKMDKEKYKDDNRGDNMDKDKGSRQKKKNGYFTVRLSGVKKRAVL